MRCALMSPTCHCAGCTSGHGLRRLGDCMQRAVDHPALIQASLARVPSPPVSQQPRSATLQATLRLYSTTSAWDLF